MQSFPAKCTLAGKKWFCTGTKLSTERYLAVRKAHTLAGTGNKTARLCYRIMAMIWLDSRNHLLAQTISSKFRETAKGDDVSVSHHKVTFCVHS
jgi:hypothetical protein